MDKNSNLNNSTTKSFSSKPSISAAPNAEPGTSRIIQMQPIIDRDDYDQEAANLRYFASQIALRTAVNCAIIFAITVAICEIFELVDWRILFRVMLYTMVVVLAAIMFAINTSINFANPHRRRLFEVKMAAVWAAVIVIETWRYFDFANPFRWLAITIGSTLIISLTVASIVAAQEAISGGSEDRRQSSAITAIDTIRTTYIASLLYASLYIVATQIRIA